jgi:hypothetical protein
VVEYFHKKSGRANLFSDPSYLPPQNLKIALKRPVAVLNIVTLSLANLVLL